MKLTIIVGTNYNVAMAVALPAIHVRFPENGIHYTELEGSVKNFCEYMKGDIVVQTQSLDWINACFSVLPVEDITVIRVEPKNKLVTIEGVRVKRMLELGLEFR